jgi:uncharacterized repeat protein (TIGR02543 family)
VKDEDYVLEIIHEIDVNVPGDYEVVYKFTNKNDQNDVKQVKQIVTVYAEGDPNEIKSVESTQAIYPDWLTDVTVKLVQPAGTLYYYLSGNETETLETVLEGEQIEVDSENVVIENLAIGDSTYIHIVIFHNGYTDVFSHQLNRMNVLEISTPQEFYDAVFNADSKENYFLLTANLDFSEFEWQGLGPRFYGILDGNGYAISNLTINVPDSTKVGIFTELDGATIKNLVFDNVEIYSMKERAGILAGITTNHATNIENITVYNSKVTIGDSTTEGTNHYAGLLLGRSEVSTVISNVYVRDSEVIVFGKYVGGLVGQVEKADLTIEDADVEIKVTEGLTSEVAGGIVGRNKGTLTINRTVAKVEVTGHKYLGGFIGINEGSANITDSLITGKLVGGASDKGAGAVVGYLKEGTVDVLENVWVVAFTGENDRDEKVTVSEDFRIESLETVSVSIWWTENIPSIAESELWDVAGFATLIREEVVKYTITFVVEDIDIDPIQVRANQTAVLPVPEKDGYKFMGWFVDENYGTPFDPDTPITGDLTLFGKFEEITLPSYTVTFDTDEGSAIDPVNVYEGEKVAKPKDPVKEGFEFAGWYKDSEHTEEFDFDTPITGNITLYAKWDPLIKVTFVANGGQVFLGDEEVNYIYLKPDSLLPELTVQKKGHNFVGWFSDPDLTEAFDLETPISEEITLYAAWEEAVEPILIETADDFIAFLNDPQEKIYYLAADLDLTDKTYTPTSFSGILDGKGHTIRNLSFSGGDRSGLFTYIRGTVRNIVFEDVTINSSGRAGLIAGEIDVTGVLIENIVVKNLTVTGSQENGVAGLVAVIKDGAGSATFANISMENVTIINAGQKNAGAIVAYVRGKEATIIRDIHLKDVVVKATEHVGGVVGCIRTTQPLSMDRVVLENINLEGGNYVAGFVGRMYSEGYTGVTLTDALIKGLEIVGSDKYNNVVTGRYEDIVMTSVFGGDFTLPGTSKDGQTVLAEIDDFTALDEAWFEDNLPALTEGLWSIVDGMPVLAVFPEE